MKVSLTPARYHGNLNIDALDSTSLLQKIGAQLGAVENSTDLAAQYTGIIIVKVIDCIPHPNADKLHVCKIDDGGKTANVDRDNNGFVQVVCGAPNVRSGLLAVWIPPGCTVPESIDKEPFVIDVRDIRGEKSHGMLASPRELNFSANHDGIL